MAHIRKKREKKRSFIRKYAHVMLFPIIAGGALVLVFFAMQGNVTAPQPVIDEPPAREELQALMGASLLDGPARPVYPYSVIPGGVYSRDELVDEISGDPVVASHFADFRISDTRIVRSTETRMMHVAYRLNENIYWTAKAVSIPEGEMLVSDGRLEARARCGNMVSVSPQVPVSEEEPMVEVLDIPELVMETPPEDPGMETPPAEEFLTSMLPVMDPVPTYLLEASLRPQFAEIPPQFYRPRFFLGQAILVPEPAVLALILSGLAALGAIRIFRKKREGN